MAQKKTNEQFIEDCESVYKGQGYDFSITEYKNSKSKISAICPKGHKFDSWVGNFLKGKGCTVCGNMTKGQHSKPTLEEFVDKCKKVHNNFYTYELVTSYQSNKHHIKVNCPKHGVFSIQASTHANGVGCAECYNERRGDTRRLDTDELIRRSQEVHGTKYDYSRVNYVNKFEKVEIVCPTHGVFKVTPSNHENGSGCPSCAPSGYNPSFPGYLYILVADEITKVGISNKVPSHRARQVSRASGKKFSVKAFICFEDGKIPALIEEDLLVNLRATYQGVDDKFCGHTECFKDVDYSALIACMSESIGRHMTASH